MNLQEIALAHSLTLEEFENIKEILGREPNYVEIGIFFFLLCGLSIAHINQVKIFKWFPNKSSLGYSRSIRKMLVLLTLVMDMLLYLKWNHIITPSFIEPYQGAATGVGGILRDVFTMGARPIANMNSIRFASIEGNSETAQKHRFLLRGVVAGIGGYGNCMGVPTIGGETTFEECYAGNNLVNAFTLGLAKADEIFYGKAEGIGNPVMYVGSKTGRDGLGGAVMSSAAFDEDSESKKTNCSSWRSIY